MIGAFSVSGRASGLFGAAIEIAHGWRPVNV
jgi:hypothetical protein